MTVGRRTFIASMPVSLLYLKSSLLQQEKTRIAAPDFTLPDLAGKTVKSSDFKGNVVVLDFWATWCAPCIEEIPNLNALQQKYADRPVRVVGIVLESGSVKDIRQFVTKHQINYKVLIGNDTVVNKYKVIGFPTTLLIDPGWQMYKKYTGTRSQKELSIAHVIERDVQALLSAWRKEG